MSFNSVDGELGRQEEERQANLDAMRQQQQRELRAAQKQQQSNLNRAKGSSPNTIRGKANTAIQGNPKAAANAAINKVTQQTSRRILYWAYGALFTLAGTIPAFIYLNIHLWKARKGGTRFFAPLKIWDKVAIAILDLAVLLASLLIPITVLGGALAFCNTWTGATISNLSWATGNGDFCEMLEIDSVVMTVAKSGSVDREDCTAGITDGQARVRLASANITVNNPEPTTSLACIDEQVLNEVITFKEACDTWAGARGPCRVVVTGGTELTGGHASGPCSHISGDKIDIRSQGTPQEALVTTYIRENFTRAGSRGNDPRWTRPSTSVNYYDEGNHWDIGGIGCG